MAISTHRWRPKIGVKSGYAIKHKNRKLRNTNENKCLIELKFENSSYFMGVKNPVDTVFKVDKMNQLNLFSSSSRISEQLPMINTDQYLTKKLYVSEYVEAKNTANLTKLNDASVRGYIISNDKLFLEEAVPILENIKTKFSTEIFNSIRLIIVPKYCDISTDILRNVAINDFKERIDYSVESFSEKNDYSQMTEDDESRSTNTTMDEDAEERLRNKVASSKFRDSRIIMVNRPKPINPQIDPVEKCFLALTKMFEDNIFSAAKGLNEVNMEISKMAKLACRESLERNESIDSIDIDFKMK